MLREQCAEHKKAPLLCCYNQHWMKSGGLILCDAIAICEMSKTSWQEGKLVMKDGLENHSKDHQFFLGQWLNIIRFQHETGELQPTETKDGAETRKDFWSIPGDFIYRQHIEPRVELFVPQEEPFPTPLKYIDVTGATCTNLDVKQEKRVDANRSLSDS